MIDIRRAEKLIVEATRLLNEKETQPQALKLLIDDGGARTVQVKVLTEMGVNSAAAVRLGMIVAWLILEEWE